MLNKLLIISGPTATGKTDLAVDLANEFNGELISCDSCQIYKGLDIGTGKDQPDKTPIHMIDLIKPDQKYSVAQFQQAGLEAIKKLHSQNKLPILVGCSGFYLDSLINPNYDTFSIKPNKILRFFLSKFSVKTLQKIYKILDSENFSKLNNSDINNHYRLTRKIEISILSNKTVSPLSSKRGLRGDFNILHISLTAPLDFLYQRIDARVQKRLEIGFFNEIENLLKKYSWSDPGLQIAAYQCLKPYFKNKSKTILSDCLQKWRFAEHSDARRQSTYFKSRYLKTTKFLDITKPKFNKIAHSLVTKWYNNL